jgi:hypothetical protein
MKVKRKGICKKHRWETANRGKAVQAWQIAAHSPYKKYCVRCGVVKEVVR